MKKLKRKFIKAFFAIIMIPFMIAGFCRHVEVFAGNYYQESLYFDEDGSFYMTTHDAVGTKSTRYCTLGWTIKRYDLPIDDPLNMSATIVLTCDGSVPDPNDERYLYSFFYCDKNTIFDAIGRASSEWQRELYLNGATVYLDGIMTVLENNVSQGSLYSDGSTRGEVYDTYEGIVSARNWGASSKDSLRTHFNKSVHFPAVSDFFKEEGEEEISREKGSISKNYHWWGADLEAGVIVKADEYNPAQAIPAGEKVNIYAWQTDVAYNIEYERVWGTISCEIPVILMATRPGTNEKGEEAMVTTQISEGIYEYMVPYSYYTLEGVELYYADGVILMGEVLGRSIFLDTSTYPNIDSRTYSDAEHVYCEPVTEPVTVDIGTLTDEEEIKACIESSLSGIANVPEVRNDYLFIGESVVMSDEWVKGNAPSPGSVVIPGGDAETGFTIPATMPNGEYNIKVEVFFGYTTEHGYNGPVMSRTISNAGKITVHTPVVCYGKTEDQKKWNQAEVPNEECASLVLGREFSVEVSNKGEHIDAKGYGTRDYKKYVLHNQVNFPFEVCLADGSKISADTWIKLEPDKVFVLPVTVPEGEYKIRFRSVAKNYDEDRTDGQEPGEHANLLPTEQMAADSITVQVMGQLYGFELTTLTEYKKHTDLECAVGKCGVSCLPLMWENSGLSLGARFGFSINSVGGYDEFSKITVIPSFWYVDGDRRVAADIYYEDIRADGKIVLRKLNEDGYKTELSGKDSSVEINGEYPVYRKWTGTYMLPMRSFCVPKDYALPKYGLDLSDFLKDGQLLVSFEIRIEDKNGERVLLYQNIDNEKNGYCNRWKEEGGTDGEVIFYDIGKAVKDKMKITGTH